jgi:hypothetical protein
MHKAIGEGFIDHQSGIVDVRTRIPVAAITLPNRGRRENASPEVAGRAAT